MKLAIRACFATLLLLAFVFAAVAQTGGGTVSAAVKNARSVNDPRNQAPTVGTGGAEGGPTGLFTIYDGQVLRRGEFTFSAAWSNYDRDPGDADFSVIPLSFNVGLTNRIELFVNTEAYRGLKINSPGNLSSFYLPNSQLFISGGLRSGAAIVMAPGTTGVFVGQPVFRPTGSAPFVQFPFAGGNAGNFGLVFGSGPTFGFPPGNALLLPPRDAGNGADVFPGVGSPFGSILPGVVFQTTTVAGVGETPTSFQCSDISTGRTVHQSNVGPDVL